MTPNDTSKSRLETTYVPGEETRLTIHEGWPGLAWSPLINTTRNSFIFFKKTNIEIFFKIFYFIFILTH
jgi:hypothetical protein